MTKSAKSRLPDLLELYEQLSTRISRLEEAAEKATQGPAQLLPYSDTTHRIGFEEFAGFLRTAYRQSETTSAASRTLVPIRFTKSVSDEINRLDGQIAAATEERDSVVQSILDEKPASKNEIASKMDFIVAYICSFPEVEIEYFLYYIVVCADELRQMAL